MAHQSGSLEPCQQNYGVTKLRGELSLLQRQPAQVPTCTSDSPEAYNILPNRSEICLQIAPLHVHALGAWFEVAGHTVVWPVVSIRSWWLRWEDDGSTGRIRWTWTTTFSTQEACIKIPI